MTIIFDTMMHALIHHAYACTCTHWLTHVHITNACTLIATKSWAWDWERGYYGTVLDLREHSRRGTIIQGDQLFRCGQSGGGGGGGGGDQYWRGQLIA